ncbi:ABC transporter permease [Thermoactinomyces sp. CICC 10523]|nr:ABC transporter permease [Thermoactinomyces sp. CICC 10523]MBH8599247.1 ABC transporter permease [Thermoactinomyces sp. CICC 10523]
MVTLLKIEWLKTRKTNIWWLILLLPLLPITYGVLIYVKIMTETNHYLSTNDSLTAWGMTSFFYPTIFFPVLSGLLAANVCKVEHEGNNWSKILTYPISWKQFYLSKFLWLTILLGLTQVIAFLEFAIARWVSNFDSAFPWLIMIESIILGWFGALPLIALQLAISAHWGNYTKSVVFSVLLALPVFLIVGSKKAYWIGYFYPWSLPAMGMTKIMEKNPSIADVLLNPFLLVNIGWLLLSLMGDLYYFIKQKSDH